jgi:hypothetical protein
MRTNKIAAIVPPVSGLLARVSHLQPYEQKTGARSREADDRDALSHLRGFEHVRDRAADARAGRPSGA